LDTLTNLNGLMLFFQVHGIFETFDALLQEFLPEVHEHFARMNINSEMFITDWFVTLYSRNLPLESAARVWDLYMLHRDVMLFRVALGLLKSLWPQLECSSFEDNVRILTNVHEVCEVFIFVSSNFEVKILVFVISW
jgi:hypothetical protein